MPQTIALVDDHILFRKGLKSLIESLNEDYVIIFEACHGREMIENIQKHQCPSVILMDINMPLMDGFQSVHWLTQNQPAINIIVVSMVEKEESIINMLKLGVKGYLCKDVEPSVLSEALNVVSKSQYYYTDFVSGKLIHSLMSHSAEKSKAETALKDISPREKEFLKLACTELTYYEIAAKLFVSPKTVDGYRASLFEKFNVKSRVGLVMFAIKNELVHVD